MINDKTDEQTAKKSAWYQNPMIHYPLWFILAWLAVDLIGIVSDEDAIFSAGLFLLVTGLWGLIAKIFFLRIPWLGKFIYENNYVGHANTVLIAIGLLISSAMIFVHGFEVVGSIIQLMFSKLVL